MAGNYIPRPDGDFDAWQANFIAYATANAAALGLDPLVDIPPLTTAQGTWTTDFAANTSAQAAAQSAREGKDAARDAYVGLIRPLVLRLQASPDVDDTERAALGITVPDRIATPAAVPTTRPVVKVDTRQRIRNERSFADEATPTRTGTLGGADGGKTANYMLRWENTRGEPGPWTNVGLAIESEMTLSNQERGKEWEYGVIAVNKAGEGTPSNIVMAVL